MISGVFSYYIYSIIALQADCAVDVGAAPSERRMLKEARIYSRGIVAPGMERATKAAFAANIGNIFKKTNAVDLST